MLEARTFYTVLCNRCGKDAFAEDDVAAYSDAESAVEVLRDSHDWLTADGKHFCHDCVVWDDTADERVVRP